MGGDKIGKKKGNMAILLQCICAFDKFLLNPYLNLDA